MTPPTSPQPVGSPLPLADRPVGSGIEYERFLDCVHCGLCTASCPTYLETGDENDSPRGRIYLMRAVVDGRIDLSPRVQNHLDLRLDCRACETACPSGVQYGRLIEPFRADQKRASARQGQPENTDWFHRFILYGLFPFRNRMRWALWPARVAQVLGLDRLAESTGILRLLPERLRRMQRLLPRLVPGGPALPAFLPAIGPRRARVALFTGCVADAVFRHQHWATARVLQQNGCEVVIAPDQACCGAIHYHSGADQPAMELARNNLSSLNPSEVDAIIVNVAGCGSMLKDYGHVARELLPNDSGLHDALDKFSSRVRDISEFLSELGLVPPPGELPLRVVYHDACHLVHAQRIREQPRQLLSQIPGVQLLSIREPEICCGAAGSYNLTEPEMSDRLALRKIENMLAADPQVIASPNVGCTMQLQAGFRQAGRAVWVAHPMELLDLSYRREPPPLPL